MSDENAGRGGSYVKDKDGKRRLVERTHNKGEPKPRLEPKLKPQAAPAAEGNSSAKPAAPAREKE